MNPLGLKAYGMTPIQSVKPPEIQRIDPPSKANSQSFSDVFSNAIKSIDDAQQGADKKVEEWVQGKGGVTTHDAMIALEKADVSFQLMNAVRSKLVRAYEEVMRTQV